MERLLNFFIIGVQKGGTTALDAYLRKHPGLQLSDSKEVHHFDDEAGVDWSCPDHTRLHAQFDWSIQGVLRAESTPIYIYWPDALSRLQAYNPTAKLIVALRHPTFRAHSHWRMEKSRNLEALDFESATGPDGRSRVRMAPGGVHRVHSYIERGYYAAQIERLLSLFPRRQVHFLQTDFLWMEPEAALTEIENFLGVEAVLGNGLERKYVVPVVSQVSDALPEGIRNRIDEMYFDDIRRTSHLTGLELSHWLDPKYQEPMLAGI